MSDITDEDGGVTDVSTLDEQENYPPPDSLPQPETSPEVRLEQSRVDTNR